MIYSGAREKGSVKGKGQAGILRGKDKGEWENFRISLHWKLMEMIGKLDGLKEISVKCGKAKSIRLPFGAHLKNSGPYPGPFKEGFNHCKDNGPARP